MPKTTIETKVASAKLFDSKFEAGARKAAKDGADTAVKNNTKYTAGAAKTDGYIVELKLSVDLDADARELTASCKWDIYLVEKGTKKLFPNLKQSRAASATAQGISPDRIRQANIDDVVASAAENEVEGILKKLP